MKKNYSRRRRMIFPAAVLGGGIDYLDTVIAAAEWDVDPINSQTQINNIASPASGASQSDYDFYSGADGSVASDDPTYTAGSPNYLALDGGDHCDLTSGANTTLLRDAHKTTGGTAITIGLAFRTGALGLFQTLFSTYEGADKGFRVMISAADVLTFQHRNDSGTDSWTEATLSPNTDYFLLVGWDLTTSTTNIEFWLNSTTGSTNTDDTARATTTNPSNPFRLASYAGTPAWQMQTGTRIYNFCGFNKVLSDAEAALAYTNIETRTGIDFTP